MKLINVLDNFDLVNSIIERHGYSPEHNLWWFLYNCDKDSIPYYFSYDETKGDEQGMLVSYFPKSREYYFFSEVIGKEKDRIRCFMAFVDFAFSNNAKKICLEIDEFFREKVLEALKEDKYAKVYRTTKPNAIETSSVWDMKQWNGDLMQGKEWKDLRNRWNTFFREHKVEFKTADEVSKDEMNDLLMRWKSQRTTGDRTYLNRYNKMIKAGFKGCKTRFMVVDGKLSAMTAGFKVPTRNLYYSCVGIYDRDVKNIGEISNMDDLINLKRNGYETVDFGCGGESLSAFKEKFRPTSHYKTYYFSIVKKEVGEKDNKRDNKKKSSNKTKKKQ